jgi:hypothetical protein
VALATILLGAAPLGAQQGSDAVLRAMARGTQAFASGDFTTAEHEFDDATSAIGAVWGGTPEAARARSLWYEESVKPFKGDPYERMMAFYYRGLLFLRSGDFGNAQAAFRMAVQQDAFAEEEQYVDDVVAPLFLQGFALQAQGSKGAAREAYARVKKRRPDFATPDVDAAVPNTLLVIETGKGPRKVPDGIGSYKLRYFRGKSFTEGRASVVVDGGAPVQAYPMEDVYLQAATRGGRPLDYVFEGKAAFAERTGSTGSALTTIGSALAIEKYNNSEGTSNSSMGRIGDAANVVGVAALALSVRAKPAVDSRYWDNLPDAIHVLPMTLSPGAHTVRVTFATSAGEPVAGLDRDVSVTIPTSGVPQLVWVTSQPRASRYLPSGVSLK